MISCTAMMSKPNSSSFSRKVTSCVPSAPALAAGFTVSVAIAVPLAPGVAGPWSLRTLCFFMVLSVLEFVGLGCDFLNRLQDLLGRFQSLFGGGRGLGAGAIHFFGGGCNLLAGFGRLLQSIHRYVRSLRNDIDAKLNFLDVLGHTLQVRGRDLGSLGLFFGLDAGAFNVGDNFRDLALDALYQVLDSVGILAALVGERADVPGHNREAPSKLTSSRRFYVAVDRQHARLHRHHHDG